MSEPCAVIFICPACQSSYDAGGLCQRCIRARQYVVLVQEDVGPLQPLGTIRPTVLPRIALPGWTQVSWTLGGGFVRGAVLLLSGSPGIGKSTLALLLADAATKGMEGMSEVLYLSTEFASGELRQLGDRIGLVKSAVIVGYTTEWNQAEEWIVNLRPHFLVIDAVNGLRLDTGKGRSSELVTVVERLVGLARAQRTGMLLVCHETKEGEPAGPRTVEHLVDGIVWLGVEGDRVIWEVGSKYRFGPAGLRATLRRSDTGRLDEA